MTPIPLALAKCVASPSSASSSALISNTQHNLGKRWQFSGGKYQGAEGGWNPGWDWTRPKGWTGSWEVGKLFMWTGLIFGCLLGGFLLIVFIFWSCGMLDDGRLKRRARKLTRKGPQIKEQQLVRTAKKKDKVATSGTAAEERDDRADQENKSHVDGKIDALLSVSSHNNSSVPKLIEREEPVASCSIPSTYDTGHQKDKGTAANHLRDIALEPIPKRQTSEAPFDWPWEWTGLDNHESLHPDKLEPTPSSKGSTNFEDLTTGRQRGATNRASARTPNNSMHPSQARNSSPS